MCMRMCMSAATVYQEYTHNKLPRTPCETWEKDQQLTPVLVLRCCQPQGVKGMLHPPPTFVTPFQE